ncbi:MAG: divalent metal cation transporter [Balneolaceae bacterium]|nr:divalent metal cation transporter [Balneolaceae bacterium]
MKKKLLNILFWSVLSAAFIGPGTVTTSAAAGAEFGYTLIWALIFSTAACYVLQEASARITAVSGINLGQAIQKKYSSTMTGRWLRGLALVAIITGCAAFEAGNILGAIAGINLVFQDVPVPLVVFGIGGIAGIILWQGTIRQIATFLGLIVAVMGVCFVITAFLIPQDWSTLFTKGLTPTIPRGAEILVLGLIGTTVVPYNIFLGSGLKHAQTVLEMKWSLFVAIGLGGFVSVTILLTGTAISGTFSFEGLADALSGQLGGWAPWLLATGLFGAGISSTLTAALAASVTAQSLLSEPGDTNWAENRLRFRSVWMGVLCIGLLFGMLQLQPIPVIILAQALNGIILPVIAVILFLLMNDRDILPGQHQNGTIYNLLTAIVVFLTVLIGLTNLFRAISHITGFELLDQTLILTVSAIVFLILMIPALKNIFSANS